VPALLSHCVQRPRAHRCRRPPPITSTAQPELTAQALSSDRDTRCQRRRAARSAKTPFLQMPPARPAVRCHRRRCGHAACTSPAWRIFCAAIAATKSPSFEVRHTLVLLGLALDSGRAETKWCSMPCTCARAPSREIHQGTLPIVAAPSNAKS
jgi:hypothetical protein